MKKLAIIFASLAIAATPVFACPHSDSKEDTDQAPRTAEKAKDSKDAKGQEKAKAAAPKQDDKAAKAKPAKPAEKPKTAEKVSSK